MGHCKQRAKCNVFYFPNKGMTGQTHPGCILLGDTFLIRGHLLGGTFRNLGFKPQEAVANVLVALLVALFPHFTPERH